MVSSVMEENIKKLREAGYLAADIAHRLPNAGQIIPTPEPHERVVFLTHFVRGLGFPLHPFVRGLMFFYGLDFHNLAPNFILNISVFIVVCEAFLRPNFSINGQIWLLGQLDGLLCNGEEHQGSVGGEVPDGGDQTQASNPRQVIPTPEADERVVFIPHFLRGLGSPFTLSSEVSCTTTGWISMIWPPISSSTSRCSLSCARPSSALRPTLAYR